MKMKLDIENRLTLLNEINLAEDTQEIYNKKIKELIKLIIEVFKIQLDNSTEKRDIIDIIYKIRYYKSIPITNNQKVQDIANFDNLEKYVITIACKEKVLNIISRNIMENYEIIKNVFQTDIIKLEKIHLKINKEQNKYILEIYEEENKTANISFENLAELNIAENKKVKLFI